MTAYALLLSSMPSFQVRMQAHPHSLTSVRSLPLEPLEEIYIRELFHLFHIALGFDNFLVVE